MESDGCCSLFYNRNVPAETLSFIWYIPKRLFPKRLFRNCKYNAIFRYGSQVGTDIFCKTLILSFRTVVFLPSESLSFSLPNRCLSPFRIITFLLPNCFFLLFTDISLPPSTNADISRQCPLAMWYLCRVIRLQTYLIQMFNTKKRRVV